MKIRIALLACIFTLFGCGGGNGPSALYTVSGTVDHLSSPGPTLTNGTTAIAIASGAIRFVFPDQLVDGTVYQISVASQPADENCVISQGGGTVVGANVGNVDVACNTVISSPTAVGIYPVATGPDGYSRAYVPVTMVGNNPVSINAAFDTASAGVVLNAFDVVPSSMVSIKGFNLPAGHNTIAYNGITVTNNVMTTYLNGQGAGIDFGSGPLSGAYSTNGPLIAATGNLAYAQLTFGSGAAVTTAVVPILLVYQVSTRANGPALPSTVASNVFGVGGIFTPIGPLTGAYVYPTTTCATPPGSSGACDLVSPLRSLSFTSNIDPGFLLAPLSLQNCQIGTPGSCTAAPSLTLGVNNATTQVLGFANGRSISAGCSSLTLTYVPPASYGCGPPYYDRELESYDNLTSVTAVLLDTGNSGMTLGPGNPGVFPATIAADTQVTIQFGQTGRGALPMPTYIYQFTTGTGVYTTTVLPNSTVTDLGIGFFTTHRFYIDYSRGDSRMGVRPAMSLLTGRQLLTHLRTDLERPQSRRVIVNLRGEHQLVGAGLIDDRLQRFAHRITIAYCRAGERVRHVVQFHLRRIEPLDRRLQLTRRAAPQIDELLLQRGEKAPRFLVAIRGEQIDADHRIRFVERGRRTELRAIRLQRVQHVIRREMRRERERQAERRGELSAEERRAEQP